MTQEHNGDDEKSESSLFVMVVYMLKESSNCKMGMHGTIKCRPKVVYWVHGVQVDGIIIRDWTDDKILPKRDIDPILF